jgi:hypothetical protein
VVGVLAVGAAIAVPLGLARAQSPSESESGSESEGARGEWAQAKEQALDRFAEELGVTREELDAAFSTVVSEQLDAAVEDGRLTQEQADRLRERLDERAFGFGFGGHGPGRWGGWGGRGGFGGEEVAPEAAGAAGEAALAEVGGGEVVGVFSPRRGDAAYAVAVRTDDGHSLVLLDEEFQVLDVRGWGEAGRQGTPAE